MLQIITIICVTHVQKISFKIQASIKQLLTKYQIFTILPQISHFHKNRNFSSIFCNFLDQLLHPYKFYGRDMSEIPFFIFASCEPLTLQVHERQYQIVNTNTNKYENVNLLVEVRYEIRRGKLATLVYIFTKYVTQITLI